MTGYLPFTNRRQQLSYGLLLFTYISTNEHPYEFYRLKQALFIKISPTPSPYRLQVI